MKNNTFHKGKKFYNAKEEDDIITFSDKAVETGIMNEVYQNIEFISDTEFKAERIIYEYNGVYSEDDINIEDVHPDSLIEKKCFWCKQPHKVIKDGYVRMKKTKPVIISTQNYKLRIE